MDCYYTSVEENPRLNQRKCMSMLYQFSSTIVYTRELNPEILYAIDNQRTPLASIPDLPDALQSTGTGQGGGAPGKTGAPATPKPAAGPASAAAGPASAAAKSAASKPAKPAPGAAKTAKAAAPKLVSQTPIQKLLQLQQLRKERQENLQAREIHYLQILREQLHQVHHGLTYQQLQEHLTQLEKLALLQNEKLKNLGLENIQAILQQVPETKLELKKKNTTRRGNTTTATIIGIQPISTRGNSIPPIVRIVRITTTTKQISKL